MNDGSAAKRDCFSSPLQRRRPDGVKLQSQVKRLCVKCLRLTAPDGFAHTYNGYTCVCLGCDELPQADAGTDFQRRYEM